MSHHRTAVRSFATIGALALMCVATVATAPLAHADTVLTASASAVGTDAISTTTCLSSSDALPAAVTATYDLTRGGTSVAHGSWTVGGDGAVLIRVQECPAALETWSVTGLAPDADYVLTVTYVLDPRVTGDDGEYVTDPARSAVTLTGTASVRTWTAYADDDAGAASDQGSAGSSPPGTDTQAALAPPSSTPNTPEAPGTAVDPPATVVELPVTAQDLASLSASELARITPAQFARMSPSVLVGLRPAQAAVLTPRHVAGLAPRALAAIRPAALTRLSPRALAALSVRQLSALTPRQERALTARQLAGLSPLQLGALGSR